MSPRSIVLGYFAAVGLITTCLTGIATAQTFTVGVGQVQLDVPAGVDMWGYLPPRKSQGTLDPLMARIFVFGDGQSRAVLVTLDLGRTPNQRQMDRARRMVRDRAGIQTVIFTASHTHSGPYLLDQYPDDRPPEWESRMIEAIAEGIIHAAESAAPARLGSGRGWVQIGHNRRYVNPDGSVRMLWENPTRISTHPVDPEVLVLRIDDLEGRPRGLIVGYACHPVVFGPDNALYSADFPGAMSRYVSDRLDGSPVVAFVQGGCGDINPFMDKRRLEEDARELMRRVGEELGREALRVAEATPTLAPAAPSVQSAIETLTLQDRRAEGTSYEAPVTVLLLNGRHAFVGLPGEPFVEFQLELKRRAGTETAFFLGYTNGYLRYFPTIRAAVEGGYGAAEMAMTEVGAGERLLRRGTVILYRMLGRLSESPETE